MICALRGAVSDICGNVITLDVSGVGYEVYATSALLAEAAGVGAALKVTVHTDVREDQIRLYGFADKLERQVFELLLRVSGIGAKSAHDIVSNIDKKELLQAIAAGNSSTLQQIKGIGKKTAERIIIELQDKVGQYKEEFGGSTGSPSHQLIAGRGKLSDAVEALVTLGFQRREAEKALDLAGKSAPGGLPDDVGEIVKSALRYV